MNIDESSVSFIFVQLGLSSVMCMLMKEVHVKGAALTERCLLQRAIEKLEMSVVSNCLKCIRMGRGDRYVSLPTSLHIINTRSSSVGLDVRRLTGIDVGPMLLFW